MQLRDQVLIKSSKTIACFVLFIFVAIFISLMLSSHDAWKTFGLSFLYNTEWNPAHHAFSALTAIIGTLVTAVIAIIIALPISLSISVLTTNILPARLKSYISVCMHILAGIPSIVYGMWGLFIITPIFALYIEPFLEKTLGRLPIVGALFQGIPMGISILLAGFILAIMIIPLLTNMMISLMNKVPPLLKESAYATGATRFEVVRKIQLPYLRSGIIGSVILGLGRALGETMAVTFVIGNSHALSISLFAPGSTIASTIANEFSEATTKLYGASLMGLALVLMFITFGSIIAARLLLKRYEK